MTLKTIAKVTGALGLFATLNLSVYGSITVNIGGQNLYTAGGASLMDGGLIVLVASTSDGLFSAPTENLFASGDDVVVASFAGDTDVNAGQFGAKLEMNLTDHSGWTAGDILMLYWYPTLNTGSTKPGANTPYGSYRTDLAIDGSTTGWVTPSDGQTVGLTFLTALAGSSVNAESAGYADSTTPVPEPSNGTVALIGGGIACVAGMTWRLRGGRRPQPLG